MNPVQTENEFIIHQAQSIQVNLLGQIDTKHEGMIVFEKYIQIQKHDAQYDFFGQKLATCSSDGKVIIYDVSKPQNCKKIALIEGHKCPVWQVRWCHPRYGVRIASCSFDKTVQIWSEYNNIWYKSKEFPAQKASVNCIEWVPYQFGLKLVSGCADGNMTLYQKNDFEEEWEESIQWKAHDRSVNAIAWAPICPLSDIKLIDSVEQQNMVLVTGGCDYQLIIWNFDQKNRAFIKIKSIDHKCWIRSISFSPVIDEDIRTFAFAIENGTIKICELNLTNFVLQNEKQLKFDNMACWKVSWSPQGNQLAITCGSIQTNESFISVYQQNCKGEFMQIQKI